MPLQVLTFLRTELSIYIQFTEQTSIALTGVYYSSVAWGDYDNDGDLDILLDWIYRHWPNIQNISQQRG